MAPAETPPQQQQQQQQQQQHTNSESNSNGHADPKAAQPPAIVISNAIHRILHQIPGENADRPGLSKTPDRYAQALLELTQGYSQDVDAIVNGALFDVETDAGVNLAVDDEENDMGVCTQHDGLVVQRDIEIFSLCEHHMLPFFGKMHIAYLPGPSGRVIGLSKLARLANLFARRLQVQERLTRQVAEALERVLGGAAGVAVVGECTHLCMAMRGVRQAGAVTRTESLRGVFKKEDTDGRVQVVQAMLGVGKGA